MNTDSFKFNLKIFDRCYEADFDSRIMGQNDHDSVAKNKHAVRINVTEFNM